VGIAVALDWGLIVPVLKNSEEKISWAWRAASTISPSEPREETQAGRGQEGTSRSRTQAFTAG